MLRKNLAQALDHGASCSVYIAFTMATRTVRIRPPITTSQTSVTGMKTLPAQAHDLVVAIARESRAEPQEQQTDEEDLEQQPEQAAGSQPGMPTSQRSALGSGDSQPPRNMIDASAATRIMLAYSARKNTANAMPEYSTSGTGHDFRFAFSHVERRAVGFGHARDKVHEEHREQRNQFQHRSRPQRRALLRDDVGRFRLPDTMSTHTSAKPMAIS